MINIKLSDEVSEFLRMNSNMVIIDGIEYFQPAQWWYKLAYMGSNNIFEVYKELPNKEQDNGK